MNYKLIAFGTLAFFISSFVVQGLLGFAVAGEYFQNIIIFRNPPILPMAMGQTIISGIAFSILYPNTNFTGTPIHKGLKFGLFIGFIMVPFLAIDLPARFMIPSVGTWVSVQGILGLIHYTVAGILVAVIYKKDLQARTE